MGAREIDYVYRVCVYGKGIKLILIWDFFLKKQLQDRLILLPCRKADKRCFQQGKQDVKAEIQNGHITVSSNITHYIVVLNA